MIKIPYKEENTFIRNLFIKENGDWVLPYQHYIITEKVTKNNITDYKYTTIFENGVFISSNEGESWDCSEEPSYLNDTVKLEFPYHENNVVELSDGSLAMLMRVDKTGFIYRTDSFDNGMKWSKPYATNIPNPGAKFRLFKLRDGRIILINNPNNIKYAPYLFHGVCRNPLSMWISNDDMKSWYLKRDLITFPGRLSYPDGFIDEKEEYVHFTFDYNRHDVIYVGAAINV
jgi:predicted neuraminidase